MDVGTHQAGAVVVGLMTHVALAHTVAEQDLEFARKAAEGGLMEVQFGELAQEQAKDEQVVQFGERMVQDHGEANEKLKAIAEQKGIQLPQELPEDAQHTCPNGSASDATRIGTDCGARRSQAACIPKERK
jgi:predicted outer membrane protein